MPETIFIGLGSNLDQPAQNVRTAFAALSDIDGISSPQLSPLYQTPPYGVLNQPEFINAVAKFQTTLAPHIILNFLLSIEEKMGRVRKEKWGPRLIDLDLLFYGDQVLEEDGLKIPHPGIPERDFVLVPLMDIAPEWQHPTLNKNIRALLTALGDTSSVVQIKSNR